MCVPPWEVKGTILFYKYESNIYFKVLIIKIFLNIIVYASVAPIIQISWNLFYTDLPYVREWRVSACVSRRGMGNISPGHGSHLSPLVETSPLGKVKSVPPQEGI